MAELILGENLNVGMHVTVVQGKGWDRVQKVAGGQVGGVLEEMLGLSSGARGGITQVTREEDKRFNGEILEIRAIQLPFVAVTFLTADNTDFVGRSTVLDIREYKMIEVDENYQREMLAIDPNKRVFKQ
jgi:hypothetical protein